MELVGPSSPFRVQVSIRGQRFEMAMSVAVTTCAMFHTFFTSRANFSEEEWIGAAYPPSNSAATCSRGREGEEEEEQHARPTVTAWGGDGHAAVCETYPDGPAMKTVLELAQEQPDRVQAWWGKDDPDWLRREWYTKRVAPRVRDAMQRWSLPSNEPEIHHGGDHDKNIDNLQVKCGFIHRVWHAIRDSTSISSLRGSGGTSSAENNSATHVRCEESGRHAMMLIPLSPWHPPESIEYLPEKRIWVFRFGTRISVSELQAKAKAAASVDAVASEAEGDEDDWASHARRAHPTAFPNHADSGTSSPPFNFTESSGGGVSSEEVFRRINEDPHLQLQPEFCGMTFVYLRRLAHSFWASSCTAGICQLPSPVTSASPLPAFPIRWKELSESQRWAVRGIVQLFGVHLLLPLCWADTAAPLSSEPGCSEHDHDHHEKPQQRSCGASQDVTPTPITTKANEAFSNPHHPPATVSAVNANLPSSSSPCSPEGEEGHKRANIKASSREGEIPAVNITALEEVPDLFPVACGRCGTLGHLDDSCSYTV